MWKFVYHLNVDTMAWTKYSPTLPSTHVETGDQPSMVYFSSTNTVAVLGGHSGELGQRPYFWLWDTTAHTWTGLTNYPVGIGFNGVAVGCNNKLYAYDNLANIANGASSWDFGTSTWTTGPCPSDPSSRLFTYMLITDDGNVVIIDNYGGVNTLYYLPGYETGCSPLAAFNSLYASPDELPTTTAQFTAIATLDPDAEPVSIDTLNDRAVISDYQDYPLVFMGAMDESGTDWGFPLYALISYDGIHLHDVSSDVCDSDVNTYADIGNMSGVGYLSVVTDVPEVDGFYFEIATPNAGIADLSSAFAGTAQYLTDDYAGRLNLIGSITTFTRDGTASGHFDAINSDCTAGTLIVFSDATTVTITGKTGNGTGSGNISIDVDHASGAVSAIYGISVHDDQVGPNFSATGLTAIFSKKASSRVNYGKTSIRQKIATSELTGNGTGRVKLIIRAGSLPFKLAYCSIGEQDTGANTKATPTLVTFNGGQYGIQGVEEVTANDLKGSVGLYTQDATVAGHFNSATFSAGSGNMIVFSDNSIAIIVSVTLPGTGASEVILDRSHASGFIKGIYPANISDPIIFAVDDSKGYIVSMDIDGIPMTQQVAVPRWEQVGYRAFQSVVTYTSRSIEAGGLASSSGAGYYTKTWDGTEIGACYDQITAIGFTSLAGCVGLVEIQADTMHSLPTALQVSHSTDLNQVDLSYADSVDSLTITQVTPGASKIYHAFSFDGGQTFNIWKSSAWLPIIQFTTLWQYWTGGAWSNATINSLEGAEVQAFAVAGNKVEKAAYEALATADWMSTGGVNLAVARTIDFANAFLCDGNNLPRLDSYTVGYSGESVVKVNVRQGGAWVAVPGTDNTAVTGVSLAQSGTMAFTARTTADYDVIDGVAGFHWQVWTNGTSDGTTISQIKYKAPCQRLQNIGTGQPDTLVGAVYYIAAQEQANDIGPIVTDGVDTDLSAAAIPLVSGDSLYFAYNTRFNGLLFTMLTGSENNTVSAMQGAIWTGQLWQSVTITDGTAVSGRTLHASGLMYWALPTLDDWKQSVPFEGFARAYWVRLTPTNALSSTTKVTEIRAYGVPDALKKHRLCAVMGNRVVLAGTPAEPDRVDISQEFREFGFNGPNAGSWRVGGQDAAIAMISAWNGLYVAKSETWHSFNGKGFDTIGATGKTPINNRVLVMAPAPGDKSGNLSGLYFLNEKGAHVAASLQADNNFGTARVTQISDTVTWWDDNAPVRIDKNWLFKASGAYWPIDNLILWPVPLIVGGASEQQTCNYILVYDLTLRCWYPPWKIPAASICTAYHHNDYTPGGLGSVGLYIGDYAGQIIRLIDGTTDLGAAIPGWFESGWLDLGHSEAEKIGRRLRLYGYSTTDVLVEVKVDGEETVRPGYSQTIAGLTGLTGKFLGPDKDVKKYFYGNFTKIGIHFAGQTDLYGFEVEAIPDRQELYRQ